MLRNRVRLFVLIVVFVIVLIRVERSPEVWGRSGIVQPVWQSSDMTYPVVNDPNITSGFTFNKRSVSLASELRSFVVLRPSPEQSAPSAACYNNYNFYYNYVEYNDGVLAHCFGPF